MSKAASGKAKEAGGKGEEIVVFISRREGACAECGRELFKGSWVRVENERALCLDCADLGHLEFLPSGDAALTRRATKYSPLRAVVVEWSRARQRYERQGILVTESSIQRAETECIADADRRARQRERAATKREGKEEAYVTEVTTALRKLFPGCPPAEATEIASWTCEKYSGRVGRSAAAKQLDSTALRLAVVAHIRHNHTDYDNRLMRYADRQLARAEVAERIDSVLTKWERA